MEKTPSKKAAEFFSGCDLKAYKMLKRRAGQNLKISFRKRVC